MAAKKKTPSAADFRKKEEADKKKIAPIQTTAKYKGQTVNWQTPKPKPGDTLSGNRSIPRGNSTLNNLHNTARAIAVSGPIASVGKTAVKTVAKEVGKKVTKSQTKSLQRKMSKNLSNNQKDPKMGPLEKQGDWEWEWQKMINKQTKKK